MTSNDSKLVMPTWVYFICGIITAAIIIGLIVAEAALLQWAWNDFLVNHSHDLFARVSLGVALIPVLVWEGWSLPGAINKTYKSKDKS